MAQDYEWTCDARLPAGLYDVAANETWLEEQAAKGFLASGTIGQRILFEKADPLCCRYRMQPFGKKGEKMEGERIELYRDLGWEYVDSVAGLYHLWRCDDPDAPELDTDPVVQGDGYRYLKRVMTKTAALELGLIGIVFALTVYVSWSGYTFLRNILLDSAPFEQIFLWASALMIVIFALQDLRIMHRLIKGLKTGIPLERPRPYRRRQVMQVVGGVLMACYLICRTVGLLFLGAGGSDMAAWSAKGTNLTPKEGIVYADITRLGESGEDIRFYTVKTKFHELAPTISRVEMVSFTGNMGCSVETTYYDLVSEALVSRLVQDICYAYRSFGPFEEIPSTSLDCFLVTRNRDRGNLAIAVQDTQVMEVYYGGETDLGTMDAYFATLLAR